MLAYSPQAFESFRGLFSSLRYAFSNENAAGVASELRISYLVPDSVAGR